MTLLNDSLATSAGFSGKTVLLTGACGGLGRQIAHDFAARGARLLLADLSPGPLGELVQTLRALGAEAETFAGDITQEKTAHGMVELALATFGSLDIAVNNAGIITPMARLPEIADEDARHIMDVNFFGVFHAMKHELLAMTADQGHGGAIVNMASVAGVVGAARLSAYAASKHAVVGLTRSVALEYARAGVRINAVCPSFTQTPMLDDIIAADTKADGQALAAGIPMRRLATPAEISACVLFAADPANSFMTGQMLGVDGGLTAM